MKTYVVTLLLLHFEVNLNFGHTLSTIDLKHETEIYDIKEDQSALHITHPKDEATKLREIIYYHIIERPYGAKDLSHKYFDDTEDENTGEELNDDSSEETNDDIIWSVFHKKKYTEQFPDKNDFSKVEMNDDDKSSSKRHGGNDSIKENDKSDADDNEKSSIDADSINIDIRFSDFTNTSEGVAKVESTTANVTDDPETKNEAISETRQSRRKREINVTGKEMSAKTGERLNHTDGKTLKREGGTYGMSLTGNRGVVWNDVNPTHIAYYVGEPEAPTTSRVDVLVAEAITTTESAKEQAVIQNEDNQSDDDGDDEKGEVITETVAEIEKMFHKLIDKMDKTNNSESKQENQKDSDSEKSIDENNHSDNDDSSLDPKEIEKTFTEILKVYKELTGDGTRNTSAIDADDAHISKDKFSGESSNGNFLRTPKEDEIVELSDKLSSKRNDKDKETSNIDNDGKQQQVVKELLKNKYFWEWLKNASAAYLEILKRKFEVVIKTEVGKQIELYFKEHKYENCKDKEDQINILQEPVQTGNVIEKNAKGNTTHTPRSTDHTAQLINKSNLPSCEISNKKHKDKPSDDIKAESSVKIEAQNLFGSSVGSGKVTNIFIYNKPIDLENIKPMKNGTNNVFVFGLDDKKLEQEKQEASDKDTTHEVETVKPDISSEHNKTVDKVIDTEVNQTSTPKPEAKNDHQSIEKDKIEDKDQVKDEHNVEHSTDKSEVIPSDQTSIEAKRNRQLAQKNLKKQ